MTTAAPQQNRRALITGVTGQDGSYLAELLLAKGYEVYGIVRRSSSFNTARIDDIYQDPHDPDYRLRLIYGDLNDASSLNRILRTVKPDEIYNLGAQSHVRVSFDVPEYTGEITGMGTVRLLEAIRESGIHPRFYQASSSELYGASPAPQSEKTPFYPRSPYAAAKLYAFWMTVNYREAYDMFACNGILFNHESPRRGETFVSRKITRAAARIQLGLQDKLFLGNLDAKRDWGHARARPRGALLPGVVLRALRQGRRDAPDREDAVLPAQPLRGRQALCLLDHGELPRGLRHARLQRHPVQPRIADPRRDVRVAQDHARSHANHRGAAELSVSRQPRCAS